MYAFDHLDTPENWKKVSNCELPVGTKLRVRGDKIVKLSGFGPFFLWVRPLEVRDDSEDFRVTTWETVEDE